MNQKLQKYINNIIGLKLEEINLACEIIMLNFGNYKIHFQSFTRVIKNNDILLTTLDYQSWDKKEDKNNDEWYFLEKYKKEILNGIVIDVSLTKTNDLTIVFDNGITIETYISNGYSHYEEEQEQWRLILKLDNDESYDIVIYNKHIEYM